MKKSHYLLITALALSIFLPVAVRAESGSDDSSDDATTEDSRPGLPVLRNALRAKTEGIETNEDLRNKLMSRIGTTTRELKNIASSTRTERVEVREERREEVGDIRRDGRDDIRNASSSDDRREIRKDMRLDIFNARKNALVKQLTISINNLKQISERIATRIQKFNDSGRTMTEATAALNVAQTKISLAESAVAELSSYVASTTAPIASSTDGVDLAKPREVGARAIEAIKTAHEALVEVVRIIAHSVGLGTKNATTTATTTP